MRLLSIATLFFAIPVAAADTATPTRGNEVIEIHDRKPPKVIAKPQHYFHNRIAPYSDKAILSDAWTRAWMLIEIDQHGTVERLKFLNRPGYDLEPIAEAEIFKQHFDPAQDDKGRPIASQIIWGIEWPAHGWVAAFNDGLTTSLPHSIGFHDASDYVPCRGSGPMHLGSLYPTYRDCSMPNVKAVASEAWINRPPSP